MIKLIPSLEMLEDILRTIRIQDVLDILIVAYLVYKLIDLLRETFELHGFAGVETRAVEPMAALTRKGEITKAIADLALNLLDVDERGFDHQDRRLLLTMIEKFDGGPVGVDSLAAAISEERHTIEDVLEPYLIQQGFLQRTPRGRMATQAAYRHLGLQAPGDDSAA